MSRSRGLGKGLNALIPTSDVEQSEIASGGKGGGERVVFLSLDAIVPNRFQPRRDFNEEKLKELSDSIKEHGVVQPIVVRQDSGKYELIAGERRWRACRLLGMDAIPAIVKEYSSKEMTEIALIENIQREDLNALEEASAYQLLIKEFAFTQEDLAKRIGKSRSYVTNSLRLLLLEKEVQRMLESERLSAGHARTLLGLEGKAQISAAEKVVEQGLSVRQTEALVKNLLLRNDGQEKNENEAADEDTSFSAVFSDVEDSLRDALGTQVRIKYGKNQDKGRIEIEYYGHEELERIIDMILNS